jgi:hypothetical protein
MAPEFQKAAESLSPLVPFYNVDCDEQENKALCAAEDIKGFPTVKVSSVSLPHKRFRQKAQQCHKQISHRHIARAAGDDRMSRKERRDP